MKKTIFLLTLFCLAWSLPSSAQFQIYEYITYDWDSHPVQTVTDQDTSNHSVIIFNRMYYEYASENSTLYEFLIIHKRLKLITHAGIDDNNRVYIPLGEKDKVLSQKARVIKVDGSIRELKKEDFRQGYDVETGKKYSYFAFEGIETGCEIEYLLCVKRRPDLNGNIVNLQSRQPVLLFEARYTAPTGLWLKFKSYNGCPEAEFINPNAERYKAETSYTQVKDKNIWIIRKENLPRLKNEDNSAPRAEMMKFAMKLDRISNSGKRDVYSYGPLAEEVFDQVYNQTEPKDAKLLSVLIADIKPDAGNEEAAIRQVENYLKTHFIYNDNAGEDKILLSKIIGNKSYNDIGSVILFANIFKKLNIETNIVLTGDRFANKFDRDFECYSFLNEYMLYFPSVKKYLDPADNFSRLGFPEYNYINTYGLFVKPGLVDGQSKGVGEIKFIEGAKYNESLDKLQITANITPAFSDTRLDIVREISGYAAAEYQPLFDFIKDEIKLKDLSEEIINYIDNEGTIADISFENKGGDFYGQKPLVVRAVLNSNRFFERAGNSYLFRAGMLIGPQREIYDKEERTLPLEFPFNRGYLRTITFNIPEGYNISNLEKLKSNETYVRNSNDTTMLFVSDYKLENNTVIISVEEYYKEYSYGVPEFEDYRRVVNAAANFNKVALVFSKR